MFFRGSGRLYIGAYCENVCAFSTMKEAKKVVSAWMVDSSLDEPGYVFVYDCCRFVNRFIYFGNNDIDFWDLDELRRKSLGYAVRRSVFQDWSLYF